MSLPLRNPLPEAEILRQLLEYDPETGVLTWRERPVESTRDISWNKQFAGKQAGSRKKPVKAKKGFSRHRQVAIYGKKYYAHRIIWAMVYGQCDAEDVDHENGDQDDNRLTNLQAKTHNANNKNKKLSTRNTTGVNGVSINDQGRYVVHIGRTTYLGMFDTLSEATVARKAAEQTAGYHPNHGRSA